MVKPESHRPHARPEPVELSSLEIEILMSGAGIEAKGRTSSAAQDRRDRALSLIRECRSLVTESYGLLAVAELLEISPEETWGHAHREPRGLHAFRLDGDCPWLFPRWQFWGSNRIPGLRSILAAAGKSVHPLSLSRFMLTKSVDLDIGEECYSPRDWLISGLDPTPVLMIARDI